jgi:hypothetical protein
MNRDGDELHCGELCFVNCGRILSRNCWEYSSESFKQKKYKKDKILYEKTSYSHGYTEKKTRFQD